MRTRYLKVLAPDRALISAFAASIAASFVG